MNDLSVNEAYQGLIMQRVDVVDRAVMQRDEYLEREKALSELEIICQEAGKADFYINMIDKLQKFEYLMASNCYALGVRDRIQMERMEII